MLHAFDTSELVFDLQQGRGALTAFTHLVRRIWFRALSLASDFKGLAGRVGGPAPRELVRRWLASAVFHKSDRSLTLGIRRLLDVVPLRVSDAPGLAGSMPVCAATVTR